MAGIVLAGGRSSRMGRDKALLPWGGTTLLENAIRIVRQVTEPVIVVGDQVASYDLEIGVRALPDKYPNTGPLGGILTALDALDATNHVVIGCDMPFIEPALLRMMLKEVGGFQAAIPYPGGRPEPLCAIYHRGCRPTFRQFMHRGEYALHIVAEALSVQRFEADELRIVDPDLRSFINVNTMAEYGRLDPHK